MDDPFKTQLSLGKKAATESRWADAADCFRAALQMRPDDPRANRAIGQTLISQKNFAEAEGFWRKALALEPAHAESLQMLGLILLRRRDLDGAAALFTQALAINPMLGECAFNLGRIAFVGENRTQAAEHFAKAVDVEPGHVGALAALIQTLNETGRHAEAAVAGARGLAVQEGLAGIAPGALNNARYHLANTYRRLGDMAQLAAIYRTIIAADPTDNGARHLLAATEGTMTQVYAADFAKRFFDTLAGTFDKHLVGRLNYVAPAQIVKDLRALRAETGAFPDVLDVGCGTGLVGVALAEHFKITRMVGIDLSENMIAETDKRGLYTELVADEAVASMAARDDRFDLIVAADMLIYVGALEPIFAQAQRLLKPRAIFAFSVEISSGADVALTTNGHYSHSRAHIARLTAASGFTVARALDAPLRKEAHELVQAHYVYLTKDA